MNKLACLSRPLGAILLSVLCLGGSAVAADPAPRLPLIPAPQNWEPSGQVMARHDFLRLESGRLASRRVNDLPAEGYRLHITPQAVAVDFADSAGLFHAHQTLAQLADDPARDIPCGVLTDFPAFPWRGLLLDCGRHFMPLDLIKDVIDQLAALKFNVLHWHLTEDQGWRLEIPAYPRLTEVGAWRLEPDGSRYGGFYTLDDAREIVAYAADRHITVVPEIEMPGHSVAALAAYPELSCTGGPFAVENQWGVHPDVYCAGNDETFTFLEAVLDQVLEIFPSTYIHIGGDECPRERWRACAKCQARMAAEGLEDAHQLQSWFIQRLERYLRARGRRLVGWDEILEGGLAPGATVQSWRGFEGAVAAARAGHDAVVSPTSHCYFDYDVAVLPLHQVYTFAPVPAEVPTDLAGHILGGEMNLWTEYIPPEILSTMIFPRALAMAECLWTAPSARDFAEFLGRVRHRRVRLENAGVVFGPGARPVAVRPGVDAAPGTIVLYPDIDQATRAALPDSRLEIRHHIFPVSDFDPALKPEQHALPAVTLDDTLVDGNLAAPVNDHQVEALQLFVDDQPYGAATLLERRAHLGVGRPLTLAHPASVHYPGGGQPGLVDGLHGGRNFRDGMWSGFEGLDLVATLELPAATYLSELSIRFYQGATAWIFLPREVEFQISTDGTTWDTLAVVSHRISPRIQSRLIHDFRTSGQGHRARYVKIIGRSLGECPAGHRGAGRPCWIFADEIVIR